MNSRQQPLMGHFPEADPADTEFAEIRMRTAADIAAVVSAHAELRFLQSLEHQAVLRQNVSSEWAPISSRTGTPPGHHGARVILYRKWRAGR